MAILPLKSILLAALLAPLCAQEALFFDRNHESEVLRERRNFRIFMPSDYGTAAAKRYPVVYWFHGENELYNRAEDHRDYDAGSDYGGDTIAKYVGTHDLIVVKLDGANPRTGGQENPRPWNVSPVETDRQFSFYFPELVAYIDASYRTIADRDHRGVAGTGWGGFLAYWIAGQHPHLVSSATALLPATELYAGPRGFDVETNLADLAANMSGVRTRLVMGTLSRSRFYHQRLNGVWLFVAPHHVTQDLDFDYGAPRLSDTLDFHLKSFAEPLPAPPMWSHIDVYPFFDVWGWSIASDRRRPGFTAIQNASRTGFRAGVREWLPDGPLLPRVKLAVQTAKLYRPRSTQTVTTVRLRDGRARSVPVAADPEGRLTLELDGDDYEVGVGAGGILALTGYRVDGEPWATVRRPQKIRARFLNKGPAPLAAQAVRFETANPSVAISEAVAKIPVLAPGASAEAVFGLTVFDETREIARVFAVAGTQRLPLDIRVFPPAEPAPDFRIADGKAYRIFQRAVSLEDAALGQGNADGQANPGESIAILLPDGDGFRAAEIVAADACLDNSAREPDSWESYDKSGASAKYSLPQVRPDCAPGTAIRALARVQQPGEPRTRMRYAVVEIPVAPRP
jgi:hypothetical protein